MKHGTLITRAKTSNIINTTGESKTDKSQFRPDIANVRDKAIAMQQNGTGRTGLYDEENGKKNLTNEELKAIAYARSANRDITEIEAVRDSLKATIDRNKEIDKDKLKAIEEDTDFKKTLKTIAKNTEKTEANTNNNV